VISRYVFPDIDVTLEPVMAINRCLDCNATIKDTEEICWACGSKVRSTKDPVSIHQRFSTIVNFCFIFSAVITVGSLFLDVMPPFGRCLTVTVVLLLVKSSAAQMMEREKT